MNTGISQTQNEVVSIGINRIWSGIASSAKGVGVRQCRGQSGAEQERSHRNADVVKRQHDLAISPKGGVRVSITSDLCVLCYTSLQPSVYQHFFQHKLSLIPCARVIICAQNLRLLKFYIFQFPQNPLIFMNAHQIAICYYNRESMKESRDSIQKIKRYPNIQQYPFGIPIGI